MVKHAKFWINLISTLASVVSIWLGPDAGLLFASRRRDGKPVVPKDRTALVVEDNERLKWMQLKDILLCLATDNRQSEWFKDSLGLDTQRASICVKM